MTRASRALRAHASGFLWLVATLGACGGDDDIETRRYENIGTITIEPGDDAMRISVTFANCLSPCDQNIGMCSASLAEGSVVIETLLEVKRDAGSNRVCVDQCVPATATCQLENPPSGAYSIHSGLRSARVDFPVSEPTQLFGESSDNRE